MDVLSCRQSESPVNKRRKQSTRNKRKREVEEPIKVVYFSNPIRITTTLGKFKGRVQELTGRSSSVADTQFHEEKPLTGLCDSGEDGRGDLMTYGDAVFPVDLGLDGMDDGSFWPALDAFMAVGAV